MAWYYLSMWFRAFRKAPAFNYVAWWRGELYSKWFNNLSEEEQQAELERIERAKAKAAAKRKQLMQSLAHMQAFVAATSQSFYTKDFGEF